MRAGNATTAGHALGLALALGACVSITPRLGLNGCSSGYDSNSQRTNPIAYIRRVDGAAGVVTGVVSDATTGEVVRGASLHLQPGGYRTSTDSSGSFRLDGIGEGSKTLSARKYGYIDRSTVVHVEAGAGTDVVLQLVAISCRGERTPSSDLLRRPRTIPRSSPPRLP